ncbi:MAG: hypothetical protein H6981_07645 [Gammaproteobacteria bacterium]|nr:hypothetical protein [Gammaproteobacteria bacterium]MCP5136657.1 hypothetical protein [Gammaproteobacteria bacterium]
MSLRTSVLLMGAALSLPAIAVADDLCEAQTSALIQRVGASVSPALSRSQLDQMRGIAQELCEAHVAQGNMPTPPDGYTDWFTYFMFNKQPDKEGNKRLKRMK